MENFWPIVKDSNPQGSNVPDDIASLIHDINDNDLAAKQSCGESEYNSDAGIEVMLYCPVCTDSFPNDLLSFNRHLDECLNW